MPMKCRAGMFLTMILGRIALRSSGLLCKQAISSSRDEDIKLPPKGVYLSPKTTNAICPVFLFCFSFFISHAFYCERLPVYLFKQHYTKEIMRENKL